MGISIIIMSNIKCFFSGMEIAFISPIKFILKSKKQDNFYQKFYELTEKPSKFIAAMLIGNNIALVVYGF
jgi:Mg2+/Co2+ transporter CorB